MQIHAKRALSVLLSVAMVLSMMVGFLTFTVTTGAVEAEQEGVKSVQVSLDGKSETTLNADNPSVNAGSGTISFDAATGTVTLTNATAKYLYSPKEDYGLLTVVLVGESTLSGYQSKNSYTLRGYNGMTVRGTGTLHVTAGNMYTVGTITNDLCFEGDVTVDITAVQDAIHQGQDADVNGKKDGCIYFKDNANVSVTTTGSGWGIRSQQNDGSMYFEDDCTVTVNAAKGIYAQEQVDGSTGDLWFRGGTVSVTANNGYGIQSSRDYGNMYFDGGQVTVSSSTSVAINAEQYYGNMYFRGDARVIATGTKNHAIWAQHKWGGSVYVEDSAYVKATCNAKDQNWKMALKCTSFVQTGGEVELSANGTTAGLVALGVYGACDLSLRRKRI